MINQKSRILYLMKILCEQTDEDHAMSIGEIIKELAVYGFKAERKSLYSDIETLREFGIDISMYARRKYFVAQRSWQLPELRLLIDAVSASHFITQKKTVELINKLSGLSSMHHREKLVQASRLCPPCLKTTNESIYYILDAISDALANHLAVSFNYYEYSLSKQKKLRRGGQVYMTMPLGTMWSGENYYLLAYDTRDEIIKHFRVDKIANISLLMGAVPLSGLPRDFDLSKYIRQVFSMYSGISTTIRLRFKNSLIGVIIDRFGDDVLIFGHDDGTFSISATVSVGKSFYGWLFSLGDGVDILSPTWVREEISQMALKWN